MAACSKCGHLLCTCQLQTGVDPDPQKKIMYELTGMANRAAATMTRESDHIVGTSVRWLPENNAIAVYATCQDCKQTETVYATREAILMMRPDELLNQLGSEMARWFGHLVELPCQGPSEFQVVAEMVTELLAEAGEQGLPFPQLLGMVCKAHPDMKKGKVMRGIYRINLHEDEVDVPGTPWRLPVMRLPEGHPMRVW
jgi:hypothetical protein